MISSVIKRDGRVEEFDPEKLNKWSEWASETCDVSWSEVVLDATRGMSGEVRSTDIQQSLISACLSKKDTGHSRMAARLLIGDIYKEAFGDFSIPDFSEFYEGMVETGFWADLGYTEDELKLIDQEIDHSLDFTYEYCTIRQFRDKYAIKSGGVCLETPQTAMMGVAMANTRFEEDRAQKAVEAYRSLSALSINLPTPTLSGQRTPTAGSPSCCVITAGDSVDSIEAGVHVAYKMTALSSGIGAEIVTRSPKDPVKQGTIEHQGKLPYYRYLDRSVKANRQSSRGGSATVTYNVLDPQIDTLLRLKSQRVHHDVRIDSMDYSLGLNRTFLKYAAKDLDWPLVSVYHAPKLHELLYSTDVSAFEEELQRVIQDNNIPKTIVPARTILNQFFTQRSDVGRIYKTNFTNVNTHTPFKDPVRLSNLCQEVLLPTKEFTNTLSLYSFEEENYDGGEVALCFLASIVASKIQFLEDGSIDMEHLMEVAYQAAKIVDNTIDQATYPFPSVEFTAKARRSIGIGLTDVASLMASKGMRYDTEEGRNFLHRLAEAHSYALHMASVRLAAERGVCDWMHKTKYADETPWVPVDTYARGIDEHHSQELLCNWDMMRKLIKTHGVRFSVLEAFMPRLNNLWACKIW